MNGKTVSEYSFTKKDQVVTFATKSALQIDADTVQIDTQLFFQRLITVAQTIEGLEAAFKYELCSYQPALFDSSLLLREACKPAFADAIWDLLEPDSLAEGAHDVLDGGALIQRIPWSRGSTYKSISQQYTNYITKSMVPP